jgi:hypothetical protein
MIHHKNIIRLHKQDIRRLGMITGSSPDEIRSVEDWNRFVDVHLSVENFATPESRLLRLLLLKEKITPNGR